MVAVLERAGLSVVKASTLAEAQAHIEDRSISFDATVLDHRLPDGDALPLVEALALRRPSCSSLIVTGHGELNLAQEYRGRGAFRYLSKPISGPQLVAHVHATILDTYRWRLAAEDPRLQEPEPPVVVVDVEAATQRLCHIFKLTPTECRVAYWMLLGARDAEIARILGRAERTAKRHVGQILAKANVANRASLWAALREDSRTKVDYGGTRWRGEDDPQGGNHGSGPGSDDDGDPPTDDGDDGHDATSGHPGRPPTVGGLRPATP